MKILTYYGLDSFVMVRLSLPEHLQICEGRISEAQAVERFETGDLKVSQFEKHLIVRGLFSLLPEFENHGERERCDEPFEHYFPVECGQY